MQFELKIEKPNISFHLKFDRDITFDEAAKLYSDVESLLSKGEGAVVKTSQRQLGECPVTNIDFGSYKEPEDGVRIKMLHFVETGRTKAWFCFKKQTGLPAKSIKEIMYGNYPCPVLSDDSAKVIMDCFKECGIYAKVIPAT